MKPVRYWYVTDPQGLEHAVAIVNTEPFGYENLADGFPREQRNTLISMVLLALYTGRELPAGFTAQEMDHA